MTKITLNIKGTDYTFSERDVKANLFAGLGNAKCEIDRLQAEVASLKAKAKSQPTLPGGPLVKTRALAPVQLARFIGQLKGVPMKGHELKELVAKMKAAGVWFEVVATAKATFVVMRWQGRSSFQEALKTRFQELVKANDSWELTSYRGKVAAMKVK
jgi:hypothetical protein